MSERPLIAVPALLLMLAVATRAIDPDAIGLSPLRREQPSLLGSGIPVSQVEAPYLAAGAFEVSPSYVGQPASLFTWVSADGTATTFPNTAGAESLHADLVGAVFFGASGGVAPDVSHVWNYEANYYLDNALAPSVAQTSRVVNNSWILEPTMQVQTETLFDTYAAMNNVLFVSGMNNEFDQPPAPGSAWNGIGVGRSIGASSVGPTYDGRSKPDIVVASSDAVSFVTPAVSGAAALLIQAAARNDGGAGTAAVATNASVVKALLLNGAVKAVGWTNGTTRPLDARWGAGELNVYNSWLQLRGGRSQRIATSSVSVNAAHPPTADTSNNPLRGWDYNTASSTMAQDAISHYYFDLPATNGAHFANVTLVWKRAAGASAAKNLNLFLYRIAGTNLVASSQSSVDNVEHLFATNLAPGRYNLQVLKRGGAGEFGSESFALAWHFFAPKLSMTRSGANLVLAWPVGEAALALQSAPALSPPIAWQSVAATPFITNGQNTVSLPATQTAAYYRLFRSQ